MKAEIRFFGGEPAALARSCRKIDIGECPASITTAMGFVSVCPIKALMSEDIKCEDVKAWMWRRVIDGDAVIQLEETADDRG